MENLVNRAVQIAKDEGAVELCKSFKKFVRARGIKFYRDSKYEVIRFISRIRGRDLLHLNIQQFKMFVDLNDEGISKDLVLDKGREFESTKTILSLIKKNDIVIDIGANIGYYVLLEAKLAKKGKIYAIEPIPSNVELLKKNVRLNGLDNVEIYQLAIGDRNCIGEIYLSNKYNWHSMINRKGVTKRKMRVKVVTLDTFCRNHQNIYPDFVRMDVEGYESKIIEGAKNTLKGLSKLFIEMHFHIMPKEESLKLLEVLEENGFEIFKMFKSFGSNLERAISDETIEYRYTINELMRDKEIISGRKGGFEIFFIK